MAESALPLICFYIDYIEADIMSHVLGLDEDTGLPQPGVPLKVQVAFKMKRGGECACLGEGWKCETLFTELSENPGPDTFATAKIAASRATSVEGNCKKPKPKKKKKPPGPGSSSDDSAEQEDIEGYDSPGTQPLTGCSGDLEDIEFLYLKSYYLDNDNFPCIELGNTGNVFCESERAERCHESQGSGGDKWRCYFSEGISENFGLDGKPSESTCLAQVLDEVEAEICRFMEIYPYRLTDCGPEGETSHLQAGPSLDAIRIENERVREHIKTEIKNNTDEGRFYNLALIMGPGGRITANTAERDCGCPKVGIPRNKVSRN